MPVFTLLGLFTGSFLNVCIDRLPRGQSVINPPSHCAACNRKLGIGDLIPLFSYLWLGGRCRYCQAPIPLRIPLVEGISGILFTFLYWEFGLGWELGIFLIYTCLLVIIFVIDLENHLVLNLVTYPGMALAITFSIFWSGLWVMDFMPEGIVGKLLTSLAGGALGLAAMALPIIIYPKGMGWGDVKMGALVGLMTGYPLVFIAILISWIMGGLVATFLLALKIKSRKDPIPSATFLAISALVTLLWGQAIWQWYLG